MKYVKEFLAQFFIVLIYTLMLFFLSSQVLQAPSRFSDFIDYAIWVIAVGSLIMLLLILWFYFKYIFKRNEKQ
jgi:hypothetical protein